MELEIHFFKIEILVRGIEEVKWEKNLVRSWFKSFCCMFCHPWRKNIIIKNWWFLAVTGAHSCCKVGPASKCFETNDMHYNDWTVRLPESLPRACRMGTWLNAILRGITTSTDQLGMILILRHNMTSSRLGVHTKRSRRDQYDRIKPI